MDYREQYARHSSFLKRSCEAYDKGHHEEALRIAVSLRVLVHDTPKSTSLLSLLGVKNKIQLLSTIGVKIPKVDPSFVVLKVVNIPVMLTQNGVAPLLDQATEKEFMPVDKWWNEAILVQVNSFTRKDVVLSAANQDGGAHVDDSPNAKTLELKSGVGTFTSTVNGITSRKELSDHHFPMLRQLAYEFLHSPDAISI